MKLVKALKAELPRAEMKQCTQALEVTSGDVPAAKATIEAEMASVWAAEDGAKQISIKEGSTVLMEMRDAKAKKKIVRGGGGQGRRLRCERTRTRRRLQRASGFRTRARSG